MDRGYSDYDMPPIGEAYASPYDSQEHAAHDSGGYPNVEPTSAVSPWLIRQFHAVPMMIDGMAALEIVMSIVRDYDRAAEVCPYEGFDLLGWHNDVALALRTNVHGRWSSYVPAVNGFRPHPSGDGATVDLGQHEHSTAWRFVPERLGQFELWAFVSVNGVYVPFDEMMASAHYVDANGAVRITALL